MFRTHMEEREASERKTEGLYKKLQELFSRVSSTMGGDLGQPGPASFDLLMTKVGTLDVPSSRRSGLL